MLHDLYRDPCDAAKCAIPSQDLMRALTRGAAGADLAVAEADGATALHLACACLGYSAVARARKMLDIHQKRGLRCDEALTAVDKARATKQLPSSPRPQSCCRF